MTMSSEDSHQDPIEEAVRQFVEAGWEGEDPEIDEFVRQYPGLHREIRQSIRVAQKIDVLFNSLVLADESDFENAVGEEDLVRQMVGSFQIVEMIGRGGMGVVYLARDTKLDRSVAIKSMPARLVGDSTTRMRFVREARLLASLNHPSIGVIYDIIEQDQDAAYLILEYVPGETLAERISRGSLAVEEALSIGRQVAEAISAAHKAGVVHRDLKPGNIKITPDDRVKVLDFGLAKPSTGDGRGCEIAASDRGRIIGTPAYMSPEQAHGKDTDWRTDIWSFGCILYEMLTGRLPFRGKTIMDMLAKIMEADPDWELLPQSTPRDVRDLLRRCLEKDPDRRLENVADAATEIGRILSGRTPAAYFSARSRTVATAIAVMILVVLTSVVLRLASDKQVSPSSKQMRLPGPDRGALQGDCTRSYFPTRTSVR